MIFAIIAQLFRRNHDARRARWFIFGACVGAFVIELAYDTTVQAADPDLCHKVGLQLGQIVMNATDDIDLQQAVEMSAEARCILMDEPPVSVRIEEAATAGTAPATDQPPAVPVISSAKQEWCAKHFRSYRPSDGTVLRPGYKKRVACPWPG